MPGFAPQKPPADPFAFAHVGPIDNGPAYGGGTGAGGVPDMAGADDGSGTALPLNSPDALIQELVRKMVQGAPDELVGPRAKSGVANAAGTAADVGAYANPYTGPLMAGYHAGALGTDLYNAATDPANRGDHLRTAVGDAFGVGGGAAASDLRPILSSILDAAPKVAAGGALADAAMTPARADDGSGTNDNGDSIPFFGMHIPAPLVAAGGTLAMGGLAAQPWLARRAAQRAASEQAAAQEAATAKAHTDMMGAAGREAEMYAAQLAANITKRKSDTADQIDAFLQQMKLKDAKAAAKNKPSADYGAGLGGGGPYVGGPSGGGGGPPVGGGGTNDLVKDTVQKMIGNRRPAPSQDMRNAAASKMLDDYAAGTPASGLAVSPDFGFSPGVAGTVADRTRSGIDVLQKSGMPPDGINTALKDLMARGILKPAVALGAGTAASMAPQQDDSSEAIAARLTPRLMGGGN